MLRDLISRTLSNFSAAPAVLTATPTPAAVDLQGSSSAVITIYTGIGGITFTATNKLERIVEWSDDGTTWTAAKTGDLLNSSGNPVTIGTGGVVESYVAAKAAASTNRYGVAIERRYWRETPTFGGTHATGTLVFSTVLRGHKDRMSA